MAASTLPILLTDESPESSRAMVELANARVSFIPAPTEGPGPVLIERDQTFAGLDGVERYIAERGRGSKR